MREKDASGRPTPRKRLFAGLLFCLLLAGIVALPAAGGSARLGSATGQDAWHRISGKPTPAKAGAKPQLKLSQYRSFKLDQAALKSRLAKSWSSTKAATVIVSLPAPNGTFQRFALSKSAIMAPGLAAKHPDISTYYGRGIDDRAATIAADLSHIGFHASVRSPTARVHRPAVPRQERLRQLLRREPRAVQHRPVRGAQRDGVRPVGRQGLLPRRRPRHDQRRRVRRQRRDHDRDFRSRGQVRDPDADRQRGRLRLLQEELRRRPERPPRHAHRAGDGRSLHGVGELPGRALRRSDGGSADRRRAAHVPAGAYHRPGLLRVLGRPRERDGGQGRADQPREPGLPRRHVDPAADHRQQRSAEPQHVGRRDRAERACGAAACFSQSQVTGCSSTTRARFVIGQIIGASNYDIGHLALGQPGGGVANLGVVGRSNKAGGCTGIRPRSATSTRSTTWRTRWATSPAATTRSTGTS